MRIIQTAGHPPCGFRRSRGFSILNLAVSGEILTLAVAASQPELTIEKVPFRPFTCNFNDV